MKFRQIKANWIIFYYNDADAYLNRGGPVSVHLPVFVVVTLKLQLQVRPAGGGIAQSWRLGWVGLSNIPHLFSSSGVFLVSQGKMVGGVALQIHSEATWWFRKSWFYLLNKTAATSEEYSYIKRSLVFWSLEICFVSSLRGRYSWISWHFWTYLNQAEVHYCLSQVLLRKTSATPWIMKESVPGTSRRLMIRLSTLLTASLVFCRRNLSAGRRGCWQPGCVLVWTAPAQRRRVRGRSDAGRRWGYLETENR